MRRTLLVAAAIAAIAVVCRAQDAKPPTLPDQVLGLIEIPSMDVVQTHLEAFGESVSPGFKFPPALAYRLAVAARTTNPGLMEGSKPIRVVFLKGENGGMPSALVFCVKDPTLYRSSLLPTIRKVEEKEGITTYSYERRDFDRRAWQQAKPEERRDLQKFVRAVQESLAIGAEGTTVVVSKDFECARTALDLARAGKLGEKAILSGGDVAAHFRIDPLMSHLKDRPGGAFAQMRKHLSEMPMLPGAPAVSGLKEMLLAELDALEMLMSQVATLDLRLDTDGESIRISIEADARRDTRLAAYLTSVPRGMPETLKYVPEDAFFVVTLRLGNVEPIIGLVNEFQRKMLSAAGQPPTEELFQQSQQLMRALGDEIAIGMLPGRAFRLVEAVRLKDAETGAKFARIIPQLLSPVATLQRSTDGSMTMDPQPIVHQGREILAWKFRVEPKPRPADTAKNDPVAAMEAMRYNALKAMFGEETAIRATSVGRDWLLTMGDDSLDLLKQAAEGRTKSISEADAFKHAVAAMPKDNAGFVFIRLTGFLNWYFPILRAALPENMQAVFPRAKFEPGPGMAAALTIRDGRVSCKLRLPAAEVKAVADGLKEARKAAQPPPAAPGAPMAPMPNPVP